MVFGWSSSWRRIPRACCGVPISPRSSDMSGCRFLPLALLLLGANAFLLRRGLAPVARRRRMGARPAARGPDTAARGAGPGRDRRSRGRDAALGGTRGGGARGREAARGRGRPRPAHAGRRPHGASRCPAARRDDRPAARRSRGPCRATVQAGARLLTAREGAERRRAPSTCACLPRPWTANARPFRLRAGDRTFHSTVPETSGHGTCRSRRRGTRAVQSGGERHPFTGGKGPVDITVGPGAVLSIAQIAGPACRRTRERGRRAASSIRFWARPRRGAGGAGLGILAIVARVPARAGRHRGGAQRARRPVPLFVLGWPITGSLTVRSGCRQGRGGTPRTSDRWTVSEWSESNAKNRSGPILERARALVVGRCPGVPEGPRAGRGHHARPSRRRARLTPSPGFQQISWKHTDETHCSHDARHRSRSPPPSPAGRSPPSPIFNAARW